MNPVLVGLGVLGAAGAAWALLRDDGAPSTPDVLPHTGEAPVAPSTGAAALPYKVSMKRLKNVYQMLTMLQRLQKAGVINQNMVAFMLAKAWTESRWSWGAGTSAVNNAARGMWGLRSQSAWDRKMDKINPAMVKAIKDPAWGTVLALDYVSRVLPYIPEGKADTAMAMTCGFAYPVLAKDVANCKAVRPALFTRWAKALKKSLLPANFGDAVISMNWPGLNEAHKIAVGTK